jgi:hypothetical protein
MESKLSLLLRSRDKINSTDTGSNFKVQVQSRNLLENYQYVRFKRISIPLSYYNINNNTNTLVVDIGSGNQTITLTNGQYTTPTEIINEIKSKLLVLDATFDVTFNSITKRITILRTGNFSLILSLSTCNEIIGFNNVDSTGAATYTGSNFINFDPNQTLTLQTDIIKTDYLSTDNRDNINITIPVNESLGNVVNYYPPTREIFKKREAKNLQVFHIIILDYMKRQLDLNGLHTEIELEFFNLECC